jgi:hypothetical protein
MTRYWEEDGSARTDENQDTGFWMPDAGCRMLEKGSARTAQALAPSVPLLLYIKSAEYLVNPVSSI